MAEGGELRAFFVGAQEDAAEAVEDVGTATGEFIDQTAQRVTESVTAVEDAEATNTELVTSPGGSGRIAQLLAGHGQDTALLEGTGAASRSIDPALIEKLTRSGVKFTAGNVVAAQENSAGQVIFMETGNSRAGLAHIIEQHGSEFEQLGIPEDQVPDLVVTAATRGEVVGSQGAPPGRPIYQFVYNGKAYKLAVTVGSNGFVVGANPVGSR
jgi:hypothetical protein